MFTSQENCQNFSNFGNSYQNSHNMTKISSNFGKQTHMQAEYDSNCMTPQLIPFDTLPPYQENISLLHLIRQISNSIHDRNENETNSDIFNKIQELRRLRKYYPDLFSAVFHNSMEYFSDLLFSSKTSISRIILILLEEIFSIYDLEDFFKPKWIDLFIPKILNHAISECPLLKKQCFNVLDKLSKNMLYIETIEVLFDYTMDNNTNISNLSFYYLQNFISECDSQHFENLIDFKEILEKIIELFKIKKDLYIRKAYKLLDLFESIYGLEHIKNALSNIDNLDFHANFEELQRERNNYIERLNGISRRSSMTAREYKLQIQRNSMS